MRSLRSSALLLLAAPLLIVGSAAAYDPGLPVSPGLTSPPPAAAARDFEQLLRELSVKQEALVKELAALAPQKSIVRRRMVARGRVYYRMVRAGLLPVSGGFEGLVDHATTVERLRAALGRDLARERAMEEREREASLELRAVRARRQPLEIQQQALDRARAAIRQADDRRDAFMQAFGGASTAPHRAVYGGGGPISRQPYARFSRMRGRLAFPISGRAEVLTPEPGKRSRHVSLMASRDTAVRATFAGTVVFAGDTAHGMTLVIDHGEGYFSVYGGLHHLEVKEGDSLIERARLGWILRHGADKPKLHFEVRKGKRQLKAAAWLGL